MPFFIMRKKEPIITSLFKLYTDIISSTFFFLSALSFNSLLFPLLLVELDPNLLVIFLLVVSLLSLFSLSLSIFEFGTLFRLIIL